MRYARLSARVAMERRILVECKLRAHPIVVGGVIRQQMAEMPFPQHHDMVEADRAARSHNAKSRLPLSGAACSSSFDATIADHSCSISASRSPTFRLLILWRCCATTEH